MEKDFDSVGYNYLEICDSPLVRMLKSAGRQLKVSGVLLTEM
jgi:hypothetical protein